MLPIRILGSASHLPGRPLTTEELCQRFGLDPVTMIAKTGIRTRHWKEPGSSMADLGARVLAQALERAGLAAGALQRVIFVNSTGGDRCLPPTVNAILGRLGLAGSCDAFDLGNACMGFLSAFDLAARCLATGSGPIAVVVVETPSRHLPSDNHRPTLIFGDAAVAFVFGPAQADEGLLFSTFGNDGTLPDDTWLGHPGVEGRPQFVEFRRSNHDIRSVVLRALRAGVAPLEALGISLAEVEWILPHQPNGSMLRLVIDTFALPAAKLTPVVAEIGSVGAASMPFSLDRLLHSHKPKTGDRILLFGVGAGVSYGSLLYRCA